MKPKKHRSKNNNRNSRKGVYIVSLGCPKNLVDTEVITASLMLHGFDLEHYPENADIFLINTCAFIPPARTESEEVIQEAIDWKNHAPKKRRIIVCGCLIQWDKDAVYQDKYPEVDLWAGIDTVETLGELAAKSLSMPTTADRIYLECPAFLYDEKTPRLQLTMPHVAYLKVAEGCANKCAYCSIPRIRGELRSRSIDSIVTEAVNLRNAGVKELIVIAQDTTAFGADRKEAGENLAMLLRRLDNLDDGEYWVRMLYTHPASFSDEVIEAMTESKHVLPYIDIPLQHISDKILKAMRRRCGKADIEQLLIKLREKIPGIAIRTTFITGFPGETEADFNELADFVREQRFERLGVFSYFEEPGTPAAEFSDKVPSDVANARRDKIMEIQAKISLKHNQGLVGKDFDVIIDSVTGDDAIARSYMDAPDIDNIVEVRHDGSLEPGNMAKVKIVAADAYSVIAEHQA